MLIKLAFFNTIRNARYYKNINNMKKIDLAYCAGLIDGEGSFGIYRLTSNKSLLRFKIIIVLTERDGFVLDRIKKILGGNRNHRNRTKSWKSNWKEQEEWYITKKLDCLRVAKLVYPYLILKKKICKIFINKLIKSLEE
jgi:DNA-binding transcriptional MerR regulator